MTKSLLPVFIVAFLACETGRCLAVDAGNATAYTALRTVGKSLGADALNRVVEVTGRGGTPQPTTWRVVIADGSRGAREIKVSGARIVSQKVSGTVSSLKTIRLEDLNLDSSGAFDAANAQARKSKVPFTSLNYALRVSDSSNKPVWNLELINDANTLVGGMRLAAHDGKVISVNGFTPGQAAPLRPLVSASNDHDSVQPTRVDPSRNTTATTTRTYTATQNGPSSRYDEDRRGSSSNEGGFFSRAGRTLDHTTNAVGDTASRTGETVGRTMRRTGATLQRFFTGGERRNDESWPD